MLGIYSVRGGRCQIFNLSSDIPPQTPSFSRALDIILNSRKIIFGRYVYFRLRKNLLGLPLVMFEKAIKGYSTNIYKWLTSGVRIEFWQCCRHIVGCSCSALHSAFDSLCRQNFKRKKRSEDDD